MVAHRIFQRFFRQNTDQWRSIVYTRTPRTGSHLTRADHLSTGRSLPRRQSLAHRAADHIHKSAKKSPALYVAEFKFRYNNRFNEDIFGTAIRGC